MNCQEVARIIDATDVGTPFDADHRNVEIHVRTCRRCAAAWAIHTAMARSTVPPMPVELAVRCRTMWAFPPRASTRQPGRRLTLIGCAVALAAAAGVFALWMSKEPAREPAVAVMAVPAPEPPAQEEPFAAPVADVATAVEDTAPPARHEATVPTPKSLPLLPRPAIDGVIPQGNPFEKALELYPQLVEGPAVDGRYVVGLTLRQDGTVLDSVLQHATSDTFRQVSLDVERSLPLDADSRSVMSRPRSAPLPDGRMLRADLTLLTVRVSNTYDMTRSNLRVLDIAREKYADLLLPASGEKLNRVVIFLSDEGVIQREVVEQVDRESSGSFTTSDAAVVARVAEMFAAQVEVDPGQIGLMGNTVLQSGSDATAPTLLVRYAWQRRSGETGPSLGQVSPATYAPQVDAAKALIVVKQVLPDAFTPRDPSIGTPTIALTAKGEVIQAGWVKMETGRPVAQILKEQLVPGVETSYFSIVTVKDESGATARVTLAWESPKEAAKP